MIAQLPLRLTQFYISELLVLDTANFSHARTLSTTYLALAHANDFSAKQTNAALLELSSAATALLSVVALCQILEIPGQVNEAESEIGCQ